MSYKETVSRFRSFMTVLCIICAVAVPLVNNFALSWILSVINGDIVYGSFPTLLNTFIGTLTTVDLYVILGIIIGSVLRFGVQKSITVIALALARTAIIHASALLIDAIVSINYTFAQTAENFKTSLVYILIEVMIIAGTVLIVAFLRSKYADEKNTNIAVKHPFDMKNPIITVSLWVTALVAVTLLSDCVISTVINVVTYGAEDLNLSEIITLVSPYVKWAIEAILSYAVILGVAKLFEAVWKSLGKAKAK